LTLQMLHTFLECVTQPENERNLEKSRVEKSRVDVCPTNRFLKPSISEIQEYCTFRKNNVNAEKFWNFYESKGWLIGKSPMKSWKACVHTWETGEKGGYDVSKSKINLESL
jgi:hypothetical protein